MKRLLIMTGCLAGLLAGSAIVAPRAAADQPTWQPPGDTIVEVTGDAANGFSIYHYDGTVLYPPTDSEAAAECSEYDTMRQRVQCNTEVQTWYRDLADLQQSIRWARYDGAKSVGSSETPRSP